MSVNPKEKRMLQEMWEKSEAASGADIPDGTYQFKVLSARFHMTEKGKPTFKTKIEVVGGGEDYVGQSFEINDNLETSENMGWFKRKLRRLNITVSEDIDDIISGAVADEMEGKVFEGQVKTKNDFLNVYVNRLIGDQGKAEPEDRKETSDRKAGREEDAKDEKAGAPSEGDQVTWGEGKSGEVLEILEDEGKARVKRDDGTVTRVKLDLLELFEENGEGKDKDEEDEEDQIELPDPGEVDELKAAEVRDVLKGLGFDPSDMKDPRGVLKAFSMLSADPSAKLELSQFHPLADALDVKLVKGSSIKEQLKALSKAVQDRLN
jgi:hypothetical protein